MDRLKSPCCRKIIWTKTVLLFSLAISSHAIFAQSRDSSRVDSVEITRISEVKVKGKTAIRTLKEQAFNVNVLDAKAAYNSSADINQLLNRSTGVRIREDGGMGSSFNFSLNGFTGKQVKFFIDGLPMDNLGSSMTLNNLPATMVDRVEIYKGVLPVSLGADALGGAVNIVTRTQSNYMDISYGFGSFNTHRAGVNVAYTDEKTGFTVRSNAFYNYSDNNYKVHVAPINLTTGIAGPEQELKRFHDSYKSVGALIDVGLSGRSFADHLLVGAIVSGNAKDIQTGVVMKQVFGARTSSSNSIVPTLKYKKSDLWIDGLDLTVYSAYNMTTNHFIDTTRLQYNWLQETVPTTTAEFSRTQLKNRDTEALTTANLAYAISEHHALSLNYVLTDFRRTSSDVENPDNITFRMPQRLGKQHIGLAWQTTLDRFTATAFGKLYRLHAESFEDISDNPTPEYVATSQNSTHQGYGLATAYFILPYLQAKASFERTYRLPEATELLGDGLFVRRNSNLRPEKSNNLNVGVLYTAISDDLHQLHIESNFILRNAKDYIRLHQSLSQPIDRPNINVGNVRTTGGEAEVRYSWNNKLFANVNATYQQIIDRTEFLVSENLNGISRNPNLNYGFRLPNMPYLFGNANLGVRLHPSKNTSNTLNINYSISYVEKYYLTPNQLGANNTDIIPRQVSHDLLADYNLGQGKYNIALECRNLLDSRLFDNYLLQKPGRSFFVKLRYFLTK